MLKANSGAAENAITGVSDEMGVARRGAAAVRPVDGDWTRKNSRSARCASSQQWPAY